MLTMLYTMIFLAAYHYFLYPMGIVFLAQMKTLSSPAEMEPGRDEPAEPESKSGQEQWPRVTFLIAAFNEEKVIGAKLANTLALDYPEDLLEIMVVSDGSDDATAEIVRGFAERRVVSLHQPERRGKTAALNRGVAEASGEIVVFSDANNDFGKGAIKALVKPFLDPEVGGVCGVKRIYQDQERQASAGDGLYWQYESVIKAAESRLGSITAADGEIFAMRKALYQPIPEDLINDDAAITFALVRQGYRILYEPQALSWESASQTIADDFQVKVRMVAGGFQTLVREWRGLLPPGSQFAFSFLSHKALRWLMPEAMLLILLLSLVGADESLGVFLLLVLQVLFYGFALVGWFRVKSATTPAPMFYFPYYFCAMNLAALLGLVRYLNGRQTILWRKAER